MDAKNFRNILRRHRSVCQNVVTFAVEIAQIILTCINVCFDSSPDRSISRMCAIVIQCAVELSRHEEIRIVETLYNLQREAVPFRLGKLWLQMNFELGHTDIACNAITRALQNLIDSKTETQDLYALVRFVHQVTDTHTKIHTYTKIQTQIRARMHTLSCHPLPCEQKPNSCIYYVQHYRELLALLLTETVSKPKYDVHFYEHYIQAAPFSSDEKRVWSCLQIND